MIQNNYLNTVEINGCNTIIKGTDGTAIIIISHNSRYTLRSSLPLVAAVLGLRHIFSAPAGQARLFGAEKTSHSGERYTQFKKYFSDNKEF